MRCLFLLVVCESLTGNRQIFDFRGRSDLLWSPLIEYSKRVNGKDRKQIQKYTEGFPLMRITARFRQLSKILGLEHSLLWKRSTKPK